MQKGVLKIGDTKQFATPKALDFIKNENDPQKDVLVILDNVIKYGFSAKRHICQKASTYIDI